MSRRARRQAGLILLASALAGTAVMLAIGIATPEPDEEAAATPDGHIGDTAPEPGTDTQQRHDRPDGNDARVALDRPQGPETSRRPPRPPHVPHPPRLPREPRPLVPPPTPRPLPACDDLIAPPGPRRATDTRAVLDLFVNGRAVGDTIATILPDDVRVPLADLRRAGLVGALAPTPNDLVSLKEAAPLITYRLDGRRLELHLDCDPSLFPPTRLSLAPPRPGGIVYSDDTSGFLDYGLHGDTEGGLSFFGELGVRALGAFASTTIAGGTQRPLVRGLTQVVVDDRDALVRWTLGDTYQNSGAFGAGLFLAGLTFTRELSIDPYLVTSPGLAFEGVTRAPGTLEVYVDDTLVRRVEVPTGTFRLDDLPIPTRSGNARYVLRDALGGTATFVRPYALASDLLDPGLHQYSYSIGVERESLATRSFDYRAPVVLGRHRVGLTPSSPSAGAPSSRRSPPSARPVSKRRCCSRSASSTSGSMAAPDPGVAAAPACSPGACPAAACRCHFTRSRAPPTTATSEAATNATCSRPAAASTGASTRCTAASKAASTSATTTPGSRPVAPRWR